MNWINILLDLEEALRDGMRGSSLDWGMVGRRLRGTEINSLDHRECIMNAYERHRCSPVSRSYSNLTKVVSLDATCSLMRRFAPAEPELYRSLYGSLNELVHEYSHRSYSMGSHHAAPMEYHEPMKFGGLSALAKEMEEMEWKKTRESEYEARLKEKAGELLRHDAGPLWDPASMDKDKLMAQLQSVQLKFEGQKQEKPKKTEFLKAIEDIG